jgi:hypothetical protein
MARDTGGDYNKPAVKVSPKRVKNKIIRDAVIKKEKNKRGGKDFTSTRGFKIKMREGDKTITNKKGEKVVVRAKGGNRVVTKKSGTVVRRKANGDRVISKKPAVKRPPTGPYVTATPPKKRVPGSTMSPTEGRYTGRGDNPNSDYRNRRGK